ncbi:carbohydrate ABC transporter permease [Paenibacillus gansuensis]|uniref:Carbohydrate ABC transporter permease n=1 Tax=Paenibacillus gansuensis TaxID=306542 RepID=A0ABW5PBA6_9BACL
MKAYDSKAYRVFTFANYLILLAIGLLCILPMFHLLAVSFSSKGPANANLVGLWPIGFTTEAYEEAFTNTKYLRSFLVTFERIGLGVTLNMILTFLLAYPLSKESRDFPLRSVYVWFIVFTMLFGGGLIPSYMLMKQLHLMDTIWALVLPGAVPVFNVIMLLNFFRQLPKELEESAFMDGANHLVSLIRIYVPLSMPAIATLTLFSVVGHWNSWFDGLIYMKSPAHYPLQTYLQILLEQTKNAITLDGAKQISEVAKRSLYSAQIFIAMLPIVLVYPFLQKYFVKGIVLGSVKG